VNRSSSALRYLRFRLLISTGPAGGYTVHALTPKGEGRARFKLPVPPSEAAAAWRRIVRAERDTSVPLGASKSSPETLGEQLFQALFQDEILRLYERSLDLLEVDLEIGLRLELMLDPRDGDLATLQSLPWELLRQPGKPEFVALHRRQPVVRYLMVARPLYAAPRPLTLRILAVAANPRRLPALDLARELANLRQAVSSAVGLEVVTPAAPTLGALRQALRDQECHVLHFMGHGGSVPPLATKVLFFETKDGGEAPVRGTDLVNKLADFPTLRLVVLNACESAAVPGEVSVGTEFDAFAGVASSLVLSGMPAVVAMQLRISDPAAIAFSRAFYQRLAMGDPVDAAVAEGRQEIHSVDPVGSEWATPVLFMRTHTGELYPAKNVWDRAAWKKRVRRLTLALLVFLLVSCATLAAWTRWVEQRVAEGVMLFEHGQWPAARERFQAALRLAPGSAEVLSDLAGSEEKLGDVRAAEEHYREAAQLKPDSAEHLYNLGHFLNDRQSYDEAYRVLFQAVAKDPQRADAYGELAEAARCQGMLGKARTILGVALRLDPELPALHRRLGELELSAGNPRAALPHLDEARRRYPLGDLGRVETTWLSAKAYDQLGDVPSTCRELREFHRLDPPGITPWAEKARRVATQRNCGQEP
jgi:Tfp pilus assembly protein PilF